MSVNIDLMESYNRKLYGDPFFEMSNFYMPKDIKKFFKWTSYFFSTNALIGPAIVSMARYPITSLTYSIPVGENKDEALSDGLQNKIIKVYKVIFDDILNIKSEMINIGVDYNVYGNAFVMLSVPFVRMLTCPKCKAVATANAVKYKYNWSKVSFTGKCINPKCKKKVKFQAHDNTVKSAKGMKILRIYPGDMDVKLNSLTGAVRYYYTIPSKSRGAIRAGDKFIIETTPLLYLRSVSKNSPIELDNDKVFHFKRPNISGSNQQWGLPLIMPSLKKAFYMQILNKAQEAVAIQRIMPLTMLFPTSGGGGSPHELMNLGMWKKKIEDTVAKWKRDPNYVGIFPFPVGSQSLFGNGKALLVTPEIRQAATEVLAGMGVPQELVFGGLQWTGSSITVRMLENQFMNYRGTMLDFIRFLGRRVHEELSIPYITLGLQKFKMIDDVQQKSLLMQLKSENSMSKDTMMQSMGMDMMEEYEKIKKEIRLDSELNKIGKLAATKVQGEVMLEQAKFQARAKVVGEHAAKMEQKKLTMTPDIVADQWAADMEMLTPSQRMMIQNRMRSDMPQMFDLVSKARGKMRQEEEEKKQKAMSRRSGAPQQPPQRQPQGPPAGPPPRWPEQNNEQPRQGRPLPPPRTPEPDSIKPPRRV